MTDASPSYRRPVGRKIALWTAAFASLVVFAIFVVVWPLERAAVERADIERVSLLAESVATRYDVVDEGERTHPGRELIVQAARAQDIAFVDATDSTGKVTFSSDLARVGAVHPPGDELRGVRHEGDTLVVSYNLPWTQSCVGCHSYKSDPVGTVRIGYAPRAGLSALERFHLVSALFLLAAIFAVALWVFFLTGRFVTRPIDLLVKVMGRAEHGDVLVRSRIVSEDEIGALGRAFNRMLAAMTDMKASELEREADLDAARKELEYKRQIEAIADELAAKNAELGSRVKAQELLMEAAHRFGSTLKQKAVLTRLAELIQEHLSWSDFAIYLVDSAADGEAELVTVGAYGTADTEAVRTRAFRIGEGVTGFVADSGAPYTVADLSDNSTIPPEARSDGPVAKGAMLAVPMLHKGTVVGVVDFFAEADHDFSPLVPVLEALAAQAAMAVVNAQLYERTHELSVTDPLTGLMNRRALQRRVDVEITRAKRFAHPLSLLMIDVDHFKNYNDRMGHLLGDEALRQVASALAQSVRAVDAVARFGGEEFSVLLPRTDEESAMEVAEKLREAVANIDVPGAKNQPLGVLSISVGVGVFPDHLPPALDSSPASALMEAADRAVYAAKDAGRNCVASAHNSNAKR